MVNPFRLAGPVFEFELLRSSRRASSYFMRSGYACVLLVILWQTYEGWVGFYGSELTPRQASNLALTVFGLVVSAQVVLVLALAPAMAAGVVAAEKTSKTLHYVLASPLSSAEVVFGKLLARLLHVVVFLGVSFPVLNLLVLFGGVDPRLVVLGAAVGLSSAWMLVALGVLISVLARSVREALFIVYALEALWLCSSRAIRLGLVPFGGSSVTTFLLSVESWIAASNPLEVTWSGFRGMLFGSALGLEEFFWMIGLQLAAGLVFALVATWRLRPVFRAWSDAVAPVKAKNRWSRDDLRRLARRPCEDSPVWWKEAQTGRAGWLARLVGLAVTLGLGLPLLYWTVRLGAPAFVEAVANAWEFDGYPASSMNRMRFNYYLLGWTSSVLFLIALLRVAATAAASITSEHEGDAWVSLTATDLTPSEVILPKLLAAVWGARWLGLAFAGLLTTGLVTTSVDRLGALFSAVSAVVFVGFAAAFGVWVSLFLRSTWRAQFLTIAGLLLINLLGQSILNVLRFPAPLIFPGFMPTQVGRVLFLPRYLEGLRLDLSKLRLQDLSVEAIDASDLWATVLGLLSLAVYAALGAALVWHSLRRFERVAGRPRRPRQPHPASLARLAPMPAVVEQERPTVRRPPVLGSDPLTQPPAPASRRR